MILYQCLYKWYWDCRRRGRRTVGVAQILWNIQMSNNKTDITIVFPTKENRIKLYSCDHTEQTNQFHHLGPSAPCTALKGKCHESKFYTMLFCLYWKINWWKKFWKISINFRVLSEKPKNRALFGVLGGLRGPDFCGLTKRHICATIPFHQAFTHQNRLSRSYVIILYQYLYRYHWNWGEPGGGGCGRYIVQYVDVQPQNRDHHCVSHHRKPYKTIFMHL